MVSEADRWSLFHREDRATAEVHRFDESTRARRIRLASEDVNWNDVIEEAIRLRARRANTMSPGQCVVAAVERVRSSARRLGHGTGATGWAD